MRPPKIADLPLIGSDITYEGVFAEFIEHLEKPLPLRSIHSLKIARYLAREVDMPHSEIPLQFFRRKFLLPQLLAQVAFHSLPDER